MIWCHELVFTIFNPFYPTNKELHTAEDDFVLAVKEAFALEAFQQTQPEIALKLPMQVDGFIVDFSSSCMLFIKKYISLKASIVPQYQLDLNDLNGMRVLTA